MAMKQSSYSLRTNNRFPHLRHEALAQENERLSLPGDWEPQLGALESKNGECQCQWIPISLGFKLPVVRYVKSLMEFDMRMHDVNVSSQESRGNLQDVQDISGSLAQDPSLCLCAYFKPVLAALSPTMAWTYSCKHI